MRTAIIVAGYVIATAINSDIVTFSYPVASSILITLSIILALVADGVDLWAKVIR